MSYAADEPWIWDLLSVAGTPAKAADLEPATVDAILRQHRIRRVGTAEVFDILRGRALYLSPGTSESISERVNMLIPLLRLVNEQKKTAAKKLKALLEAAITDPEHPEHQTARILQSLPGVGVAVSAILLAETGPFLKDPNGRRLRSYAGVAPVTKQSGKSRRVLMRHGCNPRFREACYHWARVSVQRDKGSQAHYRRLREAGHSHGRALRGVCDRLLSVLISMLRSQTTYDPERRSGTVVADGGRVLAMA